MTPKEEIVIKDSCILFDLLDLDLMRDFYLLNLSTFTTPQVIAEITDEEQFNCISPYITSGKLVVDGTGSFDEIRLLTKHHPGLSIADSSVLELAIRKNCILLSCDGILRRISTHKQITVRGMLWLIEQLCIRRHLSVQQSIDKLVMYSRINSRAPRKEIEALIEKLG